MKTVHRRRARKTTRRRRRARAQRRIARSMAGGGHLPEAKPMSVKLPPYVSCRGNVFRPLSSSQNGGSGNNNLIVSNFPITASHLDGFKRLFAEYSPSDCVISALQIIGILDCFTANLMRITNVSRTGVQLKEIELIFALRYNKKFEFQTTPDFNEFKNFVIDHLMPGHTVFCGIVREHTSHVFLIGKNLEGQLVLMDPQQPTNNNIWCMMDTQDCFSSYMQGTLSYNLLFNYTNELTEAEQAQLGFIDYSPEVPGPEVQNLEVVDIDDDDI